MRFKVKVFLRLKFRKIIKVKVKKLLLFKKVFLIDLLNIKSFN